MNMNTMSSANRHNNETWQQHLSPCIHIRFWWTFKLPIIVDQTFHLNKNSLTIDVLWTKFQIYKLAIKGSIVCPMTKFWICMRIFLSNSKVQSVSNGFFSSDRPFPLWEGIVCEWIWTI